ncbi:MAG: hypothetical protein DMG27_11060 [Acidobacteria bacterium]|nr:MAG: hypothetical protein DMG27_11060 [Acidobacteriota bacterium]
MFRAHLLLVTLSKCAKLQVAVVATVVATKLGHLAFRSSSGQIQSGILRSAQNDMAGAPAQMSERPWSEWLEDIRQLPWLADRLRSDKFRGNWWAIQDSNL